MLVYIACDKCSLYTEKRSLGMVSFHIFFPGCLNSL